MDKLKILYMPLSQLRRFDQNPKQHDLGKIVDSIKQYGFKDPMKLEPSLNNGRGGIVEGNGRTEALIWMKAHGDKVPRGVVAKDDDWLVPVLTGVDAINELEAKAYALDHNNLSLLGGNLTPLDAMSMYDNEAYLELLVDLAQNEQEVVGVGRDDLDLLIIANAKVDDFDSEDAEPQISRADELRKEWGTELEQMWRLPSRTDGQEHRLICGDCTDVAIVERVMGGEIASLGFADPPYNAGVDEWDRGFEWTHDWLVNLCSVVAVTPGISQIKDFMNKTKMPYLWSCGVYISNGHARGAVGFCNWMYTALFSNDSVFRQKRDFAQINLKTGEANGEYHRGQKPPQFMDWLLELFTEKTEIVLDPFTGSGTTIIAAENLSRQCRAIEISPKYISVALQRYFDAFGIRAELME